MNPFQNPGDSSSRGKKGEAAAADRPPKSEAEILAAQWLERCQQRQLSLLLAGGGDQQRQRAAVLGGASTSLPRLPTQQARNNMMLPAVQQQQSLLNSPFPGSNSGASEPNLRRVLLEQLALQQQHRANSEARSNQSNSGANPGTSTPTTNNNTINRFLMNSQNALGRAVDTRVAVQQQRMVMEEALRKVDLQNQLQNVLRATNTTSSNNNHASASTNNSNSARMAAPGGGLLQPLLPLQRHQPGAATAAATIARNTVPGMLPAFFQGDHLINPINRPSPSNTSLLGGGGMSELMMLGGGSLRSSPNKRKALDTDDDPKLKDLKVSASKKRKASSSESSKDKTKVSEVNSNNNKAYVFPIPSQKQARKFSETKLTSFRALWEELADSPVQDELFRRKLFQKGVKLKAGLRKKTRTIKDCKGDNDDA